MLMPPSTSERNHHRPRGLLRVTAMISRPTGRARTTAENNGRSGGSQVVVTAYVEPQEMPVWSSGLPEPGTVGGGWCG